MSHNAAQLATQAKKTLLGMGVFIIVSLIVLGIWGSEGGDGNRRSFSLSDVEYSQTYRLVAEKISKSAPISIVLPETVSAAEAQAGISFEPAVAGTWITSEQDDVLVYAPTEPLEEGVYYAVHLETAETQLTSDFLVDADPEIEAIFPSEGSETHEDALITFVFNRPMVPLTTLTEQEQKDIPITITPETTGRFKWISSRNLQFIPDERLQRSSRYTVLIENGLTSLDGLAIAPAEHTFTTRPLRYSNGRSGDELHYARPMELRFNQPVSLIQTTPHITVENTTTGEHVAVDVEYGIERRYNQETEAFDELENRSVLHIYQQKDRHGRAQLWDFDTTYQLTITRAVPQEGDIALTQRKTVRRHVGTIIHSLTAESERSSHVTPDLFDPEGTLVVTFVEDVDLNKTRISAKGLTNMTYQQACKKNEEGRTIYHPNGECQMEDTLDTLVLAFDPTVFQKDESFEVQFDAVYNTEGLRINAEPLQRPILTFPALRITKTSPTQSASRASLTELRLCATTPLVERSDEEYSTYLTASDYMVFNRWQRPRRITKPHHDQFCDIGEFDVTIRYGLLPETPYTLTATLADDFGQQQTVTRAFTTTVPDSRTLRLHNMQKLYNVTAPGKTRLTYAAENFDDVNVTICQVTPDRLLEQLTAHYGNDTPLDRSQCSAVQTDTIDLPPRYWVNNYFQVDVAKYFGDVLGHYIVELSHPSYVYGNGTRRYDRTFLSVTRLAVGEKRLKWEGSAEAYTRGKSNERRTSETPVAAGKNLYWVNRYDTLTPAAGARVSLYKDIKNSTALERAGTFVTNALGVAETDVVQNLEGAVVTHGDDSAIVSGFTDSLQRSTTARNQSRTYIYTDRPMYRPGQEVFIKGIDRIGRDGVYEPFDTDMVTIEVFSSKSEKIYDGLVPYSSYGTFNTKVTLPDDAPLGSYRIKAFGQETRFDVEEYVPAAFRLTVGSAEEEYIAGDTAVMTVDAEYFFGVPVEGGDVSYSITSQDYHFDRYTDEYFNFGRGWYFCYSCRHNDRHLLRGTAEIDANGRAVIEQSLDWDTLFADPDEEGSKIFVVHATVKDQNGRSVSGQHSFIVHKGAFYLGAKTERSFTQAQTPVTLRAKSVDTEGEPRGVRGIALTVNSVEWQSFKRQEVDGGFYYKSEKVLTPVFEQTVSTNGDGDYETELTLDEGRYEITLVAEDKDDNVIRATTQLYVYGSQQVSIRPTNDHSLEIETQSQDVAVGERPEIIIQSSFTKAKALITAERGKVFDYWVVDVTRNLFNHTIPILSEYAPNIFVSALLLSSDPEIKYGQVAFNVDREEKELTVDVTPNKTHYLPGEDVTLDVKTTNHQGQGVPAEVSIAVADLSVLALKGNPKKNPLVFFFDGFPLTVTTASNIKNVLHELDIPLGTKGGGGGDPDDLASRKRGVFKDTAYWNATVVTDAGGNATVSFTLPDNLTTWQIESLGVTTDTLLGVDYDEVVARKDLMMVPLKPRFIVPGDEFLLGGTVFNQTDERQTVIATLFSETLTLPGDLSKRVTLDPGESSTVYFEALAPSEMQVGVHTFDLTAKGEGYQDSVTQTIPITRNTTFEAVATAHFTKDNVANEFVYVPDEVIDDMGGLTINTNATMAVFLTDALNHMISYPYGCSEQLTSKLATIATIKRGLNLENVGDAFTLEPIVFQGREYTLDQVVDQGLTQIYQAQKADGGFGYYPTLRTNFHLTLHVVQALQALDAAGFDVKEGVLRSAAQYLLREVNSSRVTNKNTQILTAFTLRDTETGFFSGGNRAQLFERVASYTNDASFINEEINSISLAYLVMLAEDATYFSNGQRDAAYEALENRIDIDGRGAYLKSEQGSRLWEFYQTPIKTTALLLKAFAELEDEHVVTDKVIRWLLRGRAKDGTWGSTNNTLAVIDAMTEYLEWQRETKSDFALDVTLDGDEIFSADFNAETILETMSAFVPIDTFERNKTQRLAFTRTNRNELQNNFYYDMVLKYFLPVENIPPRDEGVTVERRFYALDDIELTSPVGGAVLGDVLHGRLTITIPKHYNNVAVEDFLPAGLELINFDFATEDQTILDEVRGGQNQNSDVQFVDEVVRPNKQLRASFEELHDDRLFLFVERVAPGVYEYDYFVRAQTPGTFNHLPATVSELYFPENFGRTSGSRFVVTEE